MREERKGAAGSSVKKSKHRNLIEPLERRLLMSHFRGATMIPSVSASGLLTLTSVTYWRPTAGTTFDLPRLGIDEGGNPTVTAPGVSLAMNDVGSEPNYPTVALRTIDRSDSRFQKVTQQHSLQLPGPGLYSISASSSARVAGIINAFESSWQMNSKIYWDGQSASFPINFSLNAVQTEVVRGNNYGRTLSAVPEAGLTLSYDQALNVNIRSQPPGFTINPTTGVLSIPAADTINYLDNTAGNIGADYAFSGNIFSKDSGGNLIGQVEFDNVFDAVGAPGHTPVADDASIDGTVGQTLTYTFTGSDPDNDPLTWTFLGLVGPGNAAPAIAPVFDPVTQKLTWNTTGSADGTWVAQVQASDGLRTDIGDLTITLAPKPAFQPGVTIITHGFQGDINPFGENTAPDWAFGMADAILDRAAGGDGSNYGTLLTHPAGEDFADAYFWTPLIPGDDHTNTYSADEEIVLVYNWETESDTPLNSAAWLEAAADSLFAGLVGAVGLSSFADPDASFASMASIGNLVNFHFIGHSRGGLVNALVAQRFAERFPNLTIDQVTTLDPHPAETGYNDDTLPLFPARRELDLLPEN